MQQGALPTTSLAGQSSPAEAACSHMQQAVQLAAGNQLHGFIARCQPLPPSSQSMDRNSTDLSRGCTFCEALPGAHCRPRLVPAGAKRF